ncbi:hypothetical protein VNO78_32772 [Psophocarpus tetragonolobus]|uniref:Bifunctional inhibitor/plant lipid transfer protein/seed storage helical domain-containing protein n=1 Tax=Psophocarpus tetragonolobus TaxID=3891 RepID=A0AAN9NVU1_PSOTE
MAKSVFILGSQIAVLVLLVVAHGTQMVKAQNRACTDELSNLNVCAPFVVPGAANTNPSATCCSALRAVDHQCLCNTLRIASQLPSLCQIPSFACGN